MKSAKYSLKTRLFLTISALVTLILLLAGLIGFFCAKKEIHEIFDAEMAKSAKLIVRFFDEEKDFSSSNEEEIQNKFFHKFEKEIHLQVWHEAELIYDSEKDLTVEKPTAEGYNDILIENKKWRSFALFDEENKLTVLILEQYKIRYELILEILAALFLPLILSFIPISIFILSSINLHLNPLQKLAKEIEKISANTLTSFSKKDLPIEIRPLINSLNITISRLSESMESEKRFTNYAAHELRTPLAIIRAQSQFLLRNKDKKIEVEYLENLVLAIDRMTHMVNQILVLSRLEPENNDMVKQNVDLLDLTNEVVAQHRNFLEQKNLQVEIDGSKKNIFGNKTYLEIMLNNLLTNAMKYGVEGSLIKIKITQHNFSISNLGKKISDEEIKKIFDRFYRISKEDQVGCGLGLSIVKKIAELHQMKVKFISEKLDELAKNKVVLSF